MKNTPSRKIEHELKERGWRISRKAGDHIVYEHSGQTVSITSPRINKMVEKRLLKQITGGNL